MFGIEVFERISFVFYLKNLKTIQKILNFQKIIEILFYFSNFKILSKNKKDGRLDAVFVSMH